MIGAHSYATVCENLAMAFRQRYARGGAIRLVGFLFARPSSRLAAEQIVPNLDYFHHRSADEVDFFCAGYGMYWEVFRDKVPDMQVVAKVGDRDWLFSATMFNRFRQEVEREAKKWKYGGGVELVLANAHYEPNTSSAVIDFNSAVALDLDKGLADEAFVTVEHLFEDIVRYAEKQRHDDPARGLSNALGLEIVKSLPKRVLISLLPEAVRNDARKAFHFYIKDLAGQS